MQLHTKTLLASLLLSTIMIGCGSSDGDSTPNTNTQNDGTTPKTTIQEIKPLALFR